MKNLALPKARLLTKNWEYEKVYRQGKRLRAKEFSLILAASGQRENRLGISVHGVKGAVRRNRIKRVVREFFRLHRQDLPAAVDIVFAARKGFQPKSPQDVRTAVAGLLGRGR